MEANIKKMFLRFSELAELHQKNIDLLLRKMIEVESQLKELRQQRATK